MSRSRRLAYLALVVNAVIWGAAFPIIKPSLSFISPLQYLYLRYLVASIFGIPIVVYFYIKNRPKISYIIKVLLIESIQLISLPLLYIGLARTSALDASLIGATGPVFVVLGGFIFLHEHERKREWQGMVISLLGSIALVVGPLLDGHGFDPGSFSGNTAIIAYNVLYTVYALTAKHFYKQRPPLYLGSIIYLLASVMYGSWLYIGGTLPPLTLLITNREVALAVFYMGLLGSLLAFALYLYGQSKIEVSEANLFTYLNGVVAIPAAFLILGERPTWYMLAAIVVVAYGVWRAETRSRRTSRKAKVLL